MPHFVFTGVKKNDLLVISKDITTDLSSIINLPRRSIVINLNETTNICEGEISDPPTTVDIYWFDRPQEIQDECAKSINTYLANLGYSDIEIMFHTIQPAKCYFNGQHA